MTDHVLSPARKLPTASRADGPVSSGVLRGRFRDLLLTARTTEAAQALACRATALDRTGDADVVGLLERELAAAAARRGLGAIDDALARLEAGTYGTCEDCGSAIPVERLEAIPQARLCAVCPRRRRGRLW